MEPSKELRSSAAEPPAQWFDQQQDHFDWNTATWKQRFWTNMTFCTSPQSGCPIFAYVGGEGALNGYTVLSGEHVELAAIHGAAIISVEHRFYGASLPQASLSVEALRLLSSQQALADLATLLESFRQSFGLTDPASSPIVTFGGSYPGALSSWARLKYPHVVHAAVSTSSPVHAQVDFVGYCQVVTDALSAPIAGGSDTCLTRTQGAFSQMHAGLHGSAAQLSALSKQLQSCKPLSASPQDAFAAVSQWAGEVMGLVQYNRLSIPKGEEGLNIARFCEAMEASPSGSELETLVGTLMGGGQSCVENTWAEQMVVLLNETADPGARGVGIRQWVWQTATQFAYYQACEERCPFAPDMDVTGYGEQCLEAYGVPLNSTQQSVDFSNTFYGSNTTAASRTFFVNGGLDPWHVLSVQEPLPAFGDVRAVVINGTSHCRQMAPSSPSDPPQVIAARQAVADALSEWLA